MHMLMDMLAPLFREVTGGHAIIKIATILAKGRKDKIFFSYVQPCKADNCWNDH